MRIERMATYRLIRVLRGVLPILVIVFIAIPVWNYWLRSRQAAPEREPANPLGADIAVLTEGFRYSATENGRTLFTVTASVNLGMKDETNMLRGVEAILYPETEGDPVREIRSNEAGYDRQSGDIRFTDNVEFRLDAATVGRTHELVYNHRDRLLVSRSPVTIEQAEVLTGSAGRLEYFIDEGRLQLGDRIHTELSGGGEFDAATVEFDEKQSRASASGGIAARTPNGFVQGAGGVAELQPGSYRPTRIEISGDVRAGSVQPDASSDPASDPSFRGWNIRAQWLQGAVTAAGHLERLSTRGAVRFEQAAASGNQVLTGEEIDVDFDGGGRAEFVHARRDAVLTWGETDSLSSDTIDIDAAGKASSGENSVLRMADALVRGRNFTIEDGGVVVFSTPLRAEVEANGGRTAADRTQARFDRASNSVMELVQEGNVEFTDGLRRGSAGKAFSTDGGRIVVLQGSPVIVDSETQLQAREIRLDRAANGFEAVDGVRTISSASSERLMVVADRASGAADRVDYRGNVQLWRGEADIAADYLRVFPQENNFIAEGNVHSHIEGIRAWSDRLEYDESAGAAEYDGNVRVRRWDAGRGFMELTAASMTVRLEEGEVVEMTAEGAVEFAQGTLQGSGDRLVYDVRTEETALSGPDAVVTDSRRGTVHGTLLVMKGDGEFIAVEGGPAGRAAPARGF